ncbi:hypothetical protein K1X76_08355 [bacterium]|nr:hypothetical protein [bacterium]
MTGKIVKRQDVNEKLDITDQVHMDTAAASVSAGRNVIRKDDLESVGKANAIIDKAVAEAAIIKRQANDLLAKVEEEIKIKKEQGYEEGKKAGAREVSEFLIKAKRHKEKMFQDLEPDLIKLVYDISEKIIGKDLSEREGAIVDLIRQALSTSLGQKIVVVVHPADLQVVKANQPQLLQALDATCTLQIRADERVKPKGCFIETEIGTIDAELETQLTIIRQALGLEPNA